MPTGPEQQDGTLNYGVSRRTPQPGTITRENAQSQAAIADSELQALEMAKLDDAKYLTLAHNLSGFRQRLRARAQTLEVKDRQHIVHLLVKEILVGPDTLIILFDSDRSQRRTSTQRS